MLNAGDIRTTYYLFGQYRLLAESLLGTPYQASVLKLRVILRSTVTSAINARFSFLLETASFDLMTLIGQTASTAPELRGEPLRRIASTFELGPPSGNKNEYQRLMRIKIQLTCLLMAKGYDNLAMPPLTAWPMKTKVYLTQSEMISLPNHALITGNSLIEGSTSYICHQSKKSDA